MKCNIGRTDKIIRVFIGLVAILLGVYYKNWWGAIGLIPLFTVLFGWCPIYVPFGISTCSVKKDK